jgi:hypothetical protein
MSKQAKDKIEVVEAPEAPADLLVIWQGFVGEGGAVAAEGSLVISSPGYKLDGLVFLAGATLVKASLYKAHEDAGSLGLIEVLEKNTIATFADPLGPVRKMPLAQLLGVIAVTRDGRVLRAWHAAEMAKSKPRREVLDALAVRLRSWSEFGPPEVPSIAALPKIKPSHAEARA